MEGRGVEPLTGPAPETASGTTRPPNGREGASLNRGPFPSTKQTRIDGGGGRAKIHRKPRSLCAVIANPDALQEPLGLSAKTFPLAVSFCTLFAAAPLLDCSLR